MLLSLVLAAYAAAPPSPLPAWKWPAGELQRFHLETEIINPRGNVRYYAANNIDGRPGAVKLSADIGCTAKPEGKTQIVRCTFHYVRLAAQAWDAGEKARLDAIMDEWTKDFATAQVELEIAADGRLRTFDYLPGKEQSNRREGYVAETQRALLQRAFSVFDLPLTTDDKDWIRGWKQKTSSALMQLQTIGGTAGAYDITHKHEGERDGYLLLTTVGRGTLAAGAAVDATSGSRNVDVRLSGETLFDPQKGLFMWRDVTLDGQLMVSAQEAGSGAEFAQVSAIQWMPEYPAPGELPLSIAATKAPRLPGTAPALPDGVALVPFADLGMQPLFVQGHPDAAKRLSLPTVKVKARVLVSATGSVSSATAYDGFQVLATPTQDALAGAAFPAKGSPYAVDVDVEWRP